MSKEQLLEILRNSLSAGRDSNSRLVSYELLNVVAPTSNTVEIYPLTKPTPALVSAIQALVGACFAGQQGRLVVNINLPGAIGVVEPNPKVNIGIIPEFTEEAYAHIKAEARKAYEAWNVEALERFSNERKTCSGEAAKVLELLESLHTGKQVNFDELSDSGLCLKAVLEWFGTVTGFVEVLTEEELDYVDSIAIELSKVAENGQPSDESAEL